MIPKNFGPDDITAMSIGILMLRVGIGVTLASHGYNKFFGGGRIPGTANWFNSMGMRPGKVHAVLAASTEMGAGSLMALGLLAPFASAACISLMIVAGYTVHRKNGFFIVKSGWEYNWVLVLIALTVATIGPGKYSLDYVVGLAFRLNGMTGLAIALLVGIGGALLQLGLFYRPPASD